MKKVEITSFLQGYANAENTSEYAVKTPVYRGICTDKVIIDIADDNIEFALVGYSDPTPKDLVFELTWYTEKQKTFNLSSYSKGIYWVVVFRHTNGTKISPSDVSSLTITIENLWYISANGDLRFPDMPYAPEKAIYSPFPFSLWRMSGNVPTHQIYPEVPEKAVTKPYPKALWRIDSKISDLPHHELMPLEIPAGAFMSAENLEYARIPETVRRIGRWAFADTLLKKVRISPECEYYETSFPEDCVVEFYGQSVDEHSGQLYDNENNILIDIDGARIYIQE